MSERRPNFLVIITDQHRAEHLGAYGNPVLETPHIDAIAADGTVCRRAYAASPVCQPSRASMLTGRAPSGHGVRAAGVPLALGTQTLASRLREAGYETALIGKAHLQNLARAPVRAAPAYEQESFLRWMTDPAAELELPYYGFGRVELAIGHGDTLAGHYRRWLLARAPGVERTLGPRRALPSGRSAPQAFRTRLPAELHPSAWIGERASAFLEARPRDAQPFLLVCSFPDPHPPYAPPGPYWDRYAPAEVPLPPSFGRPSCALARQLAEDLAAGRARREAEWAYAVSEREAREIIALQYGQITLIDDVVGRITRSLRASAQDGRTVVIFTSDHGDYMGDQGMMAKGGAHLQSVLRVPLIWRDPERAQVAELERLVSGADLAPSVLERAGAPALPGCVGQDINPLLRGAPGDPERALLIEHAWREAGEDHARHTLLTERARLSWGRDGTRALHDLRDDPMELDDLWGQGRARALQSEMSERLRASTRALPDTALPEGLARG